MLMNIIYGIFMIAMILWLFISIGSKISGNHTYKNLKQKLASKSLFQRIGKKDKENRSQHEEHADTESIVRRLLEEMNCEYSVNDDWDSRGQKHFVFTFQEGHFVLIIKKDSWLADLLFMGIYSGKQGNLSLIRSLCNSINATVNQQYLVYRLQAEKGEISVDVVSCLLINEGNSDLKNYFRSSLSNCFEMRMAFMENFERLNGQVENEEAFDLEKTVFGRRHEQFLHHALEFKLSHAGHTIVERADKGITIGDLLRDFLQLPHPVLQRLAVTTDHVKVITDAEKIASFNLLQTVIEDFGETPATIRQEAKFGVNLSLTYSPVKEPASSLRTVNFFLQPDGTTNEAIFIRITITEPALPVSTSIDAGSAQSEASAHTFLVAYDLKNAKQKYSEFEYMFTEAEQKKSENKTKELTDEQRYIMDISNPEAAQHAYWGKVYIGAERYYEAYIHLRNAWEILNDDFRALSEKERDSFISITYDLGFCCNELGFYHSAYYYLDTLSNFRNYELLEEYIIALCNNHDFRAYYFIHACLEQAMQAAEDEDEDPSPESQEFYDFLRRRMAWICVDQGYYDEAQNILNEMLTEPTNSDFALSELAYIQKMKDEEKATVTRMAQGKTDELPY